MKAAERQPGESTVCCRMEKSRAMKWWSKAELSDALAIASMRLMPLKGVLKKMPLCYRLFFVVPLFPFQAELEMENTNIALYDNTERLQDFNRIRLQSTLEHNTRSAVSGYLAIDNTNSLAFKGSANHNKTTLYRGYLRYAGEKHLFVLGRQRVPLGVGRLWNPIDTFNPIDPLSIELETRKGTDAIRYEYAVNDLSNFDCTLSQKKNGARIKGFLGAADLALVGVLDRREKRNIMGWEMKGELAETGIELVSEGGFFRDTEYKRDYIDYIIGAEYGFSSSLTLIGEYYKSGEQKSESLGASTSFQAGPLLLIGLRAIINLNDHSTFATPFLEYSLSDEMTLSTGALIYSGNAEGEYGGIADQYYLRWFIHF